MPIARIYNPCYNEKVVEKKYKKCWYGIKYPRQLGDLALNGLQYTDNYTLLLSDTKRKEIENRIKYIGLNGSKKILCK